MVRTVAGTHMAISATVISPLKTLRVLATVSGAAGFAIAAPGGALALPRLVETFTPAVIHVAGATEATIKAQLKQVLALRMAGRYADAEALGRQALAAAATVSQRRNVTVAMAQTTLGDILRETGQFQEAEALLKQAQQALEQQYGRDNEFSAVPLFSLGNIYLKQGRDAEALPMLESALRGTARAYGRNSLEAAEIRNSLGSALANLGKLDRAIAEYSDVVRIGTRAGAKGRALAATASSNLGNVYNALKRPREAIEAYRKAYDLNVAEYGPDHPAPMLNLVNAAVVYRDRQGRWSARADASARRTCRL